MRKVNRSTNRCMIGVLWLIILSMSCAGKRAAEPSRRFSQMLDQIPDERILDIPTYDGSNQAVHPDVL
jgi:hypothetical protein